MHFFTSIGTKLVDENPKMQFFFKLPEIDNTIELFELQEIQMDQLMSLLKQMKVFKSSGIDNISSQVLKDALFILNHQMLYLINLSIRSGVFPNEWKRSTVIPLPKVNNPIKVGDLHSITLLPIPSKITEKIIYGQLMDFLENNKYLNDNQFGFRKNKSTIGAAFKFVNDISSNNNKKTITSAIFIDYKKAFDSISHDILLTKSNSFYISKPTIKWLRSYLTGRQQRTIANGSNSGWRDINYGVPQGSTLGPLLFLLFVDDVINIEKESKYLLYADDIVLYCASPTIDKNITMLKRDMTKVFNWSNMSRQLIFLKQK